MEATALVVFREILEIALVLTVLMAATKGLAGRGVWIGYGLGAGIIGSLLVAFFVDAISVWAGGMGQEIFNGFILCAAAFMIGWTVVWMKKHGREIARHVQSIGAKVAGGELPMASLSFVIGLATLREGSEIVLFTYSLLASGTPVAGVISGAGLGLFGGMVVGCLLYNGLLRVSTRHLFSVTSILLALVAAGMAAQAAGFFAAAGVVPELVSEVWDSTWLLSEKSVPGQILHVLVGYADRPTGIQVLAYLLTLATIFIFMRMVTRPAPLPR